MDNCEGVLILQSLALACGSFLTKETWLFIINHLIAKLATPIKSSILFAKYNCCNLVLSGCLVCP